MQPTLCTIFTDTLASNAQKIYQVGYGKQLFLYSNSGAVGTLKFSFDQQSNNALIVGQIVKSKDGFNEVVIQNTDTGNTTYTIIIASDDIDFKALILSGTVTVTPSLSSSGSFASDVTAGAAAKVFTSSITKKHVIIFSDPANDGSAANEVCIGFDSSVSATKKVIGLLPAMAYEFTDFIGDIWVYCATGSKISVSSW